MAEVRDRWKKGLIRTQGLLRFSSHWVKRYWHELVYSGHSKPVVVVCIHGNALYSASHDGTCRSWDLHTHSCTGVFSKHTAEVRAMIVVTQAQRDYLVSASADTSVCVWKDCDASKEPLVLKRHKEGVHRLSHSHDWIFSASHDKTIIQWRLDDGQCMSIFEGHTAPVMGILIMGDVLVSCGGDCKVKAWKILSQPPPEDPPSRVTSCETLSGHHAIVESLTCVEPEVVFSGDTKGKIIRWCLGKNASECEYLGHSGGISCLAVAWIGEAGCYMLISGSTDASVRIWDIETASCIKVLTLHNAGISCMKIFESATHACPLLFTGGTDSMTACCLLSPKLSFPHLGSYPGHKQAVRDIALLESDSPPDVRLDGSHGGGDDEGPTLYTASDDASIRSFRLRLQNAHPTESRDASNEGLSAQLLYTDGSALHSSTRVPEGEVYVQDAFDVGSTTSTSPAEHVPTPVVSWSSGLVMNSASGTWPNNLSGLAKLIVDAVQLMVFPFTIIEAQPHSQHMLSFLRRTLVDYPALLRKGEGVISGLQLLTDPLEVIISIASPVLRLAEVDFEALEPYHPNLVRFWAAAGMVLLQSVFLYINTRNGVLWKLRQHVLDPTAGEKFPTIRRIPRMLCDFFLLVIMWGPSTFLFMPITEALLNALSGELSDDGLLPYHAVVGAGLLGLYLLSVSRLLCLQGKIEYMDVSRMFFGSDSLEDAMQDSHMFSIRSIWYLRILFVLQTTYLIVGVFANRLMPAVALFLLMTISYGMYTLTCISSPYYHDSVNSAFVTLMAIIIWANTACLQAVLESSSLFTVAGADTWIPSWVPAEIGLIPSISLALFFFRQVRQRLKDVNVRQYFGIAESHEDTTYLPFISVLRVPDLDAVSAVLGRLTDKARDPVERAKLVKQGAIPAVVVCYKYLNGLRQAIADFEQHNRAVSGYDIYTACHGMYLRLRLSLVYKITVNDKNSIYEASKNSMKILGNLMINGLQTGALEQAKNSGAFPLLFAEIQAAAKQFTKQQSQMGVEASAMLGPSRVNMRFAAPKVPFEPQLAQFAMNTIMNSASSDGINAWLVGRGVIEVLLPLLTCAANHAQRCLQSGETTEMPVTASTIDYACRTIAQLGKSNKEDEEIKLKIINTGVTKPLISLASVPSNAAKPLDELSFRAVKAISNLCDDTNSAAMREQLSSRMVEEGVLPPLFLHLNSSDKDFQLRALEGLCTLSESPTLKSIMATHLEATALKLTRILEVNAHAEVNEKIRHVLQAVYGPINPSHIPFVPDPSHAYAVPSDPAALTALWEHANQAQAPARVPSRSHTIAPQIRAARPAKLVSTSSQPQLNTNGGSISSFASVVTAAMQRSASMISGPKDLAKAVPPLPEDLRAGFTRTSPRRLAPATAPERPSSAMPQLTKRGSVVFSAPTIKDTPHPPSDVTSTESQSSSEPMQIASQSTVEDDDDSTTAIKRKHSPSGDSEDDVEPKRVRPTAETDEVASPAPVPQPLASPEVPLRRGRTMAPKRKRTNDSIPGSLAS